MQPRTINILYWIFTILFAVLTFADGIGGITRQAAGVEVMHHLGYPEYFLTISGIAKLLGAVALVQNKYMAIKEWAFAGIAFTFIGAFASRAFVGDSAGLTVFPLVMLVLLFVPYALWKKRRAI